MRFQSLKLTGIPHTLMSSSQAIVGTLNSPKFDTSLLLSYRQLHSLKPVTVTMRRKSFKGGSSCQGWLDWIFYFSDSGFDSNGLTSRITVCLRLPSYLSLLNNVWDIVVFFCLDLVVKAERGVLPVCQGHESPERFQTYYNG